MSTYTYERQVLLTAASSLHAAYWMRRQKHGSCTLRVAWASVAQPCSAEGQGMAQGLHTKEGIPAATSLSVTIQQQRQLSRARLERRIVRSGQHLGVGLALGHHLRQQRHQLLLAQQLRLARPPARLPPPSKSSKKASCCDGAMTCTVPQLGALISRQIMRHIMHILTCEPEKKGCHTAMHAHAWRW